MKNLLNFKRLLSYGHEKRSPQRFARYAAMLIMLLTLGVGQMWAYNEYNKKILYVDATSCSWYTNDDCHPCIDIYDEYACSTQKAYKDAPNGSTETKIWYFDLSSFYDYWEYSRGFKVQRRNTVSWYNAVSQGYVDGDTKNCFKINSNSDGMSWTYYRPPMTSASVVDNGTEKTGSGTSLSPYQVVTGSTIYLSASCVSAVDDPSMTKEYKFWNKGSQLRTYSSTNTYSFTAGAAGTTYEITVTAQNTYQSGSGTASDESTTLYYTIIAAPEPSITALAVSAADVYSGEGSLTLTATRNAAAAGINIQYQVKVPGGSWTNIGDAVNSTTKSYSPTNGHGTYEFRAYPTGYSSNYTDASKNVYEHWNIYVHDVQSWGGVNLYMWEDGVGENDGWPGTACSKYNSTSSWYTVTLDSKFSTGFVLSKNGDDSKKTGDLIPSKVSYPANSYWYISESSGTYSIASVSVTDPTVEITSATVVSGTQLMLVGRVTNCGGDGTTAADMKSVGFNIGDGDVAATCKDGTSFTKVFTGLTPGETYTVKAYAENVHGKSYSDTQDETMRSGETYTIKVRVPLAANAPYIYAFTDNSSNSSCGGTKEENTTWPGVALTSPVSGTVYKWYSYELSNEYDYFIISDDGSNKTDDLPAPGSSTCYWYKASEGTQSARCADMTCPSFGTQLMIETTAGGGAYSYYDMSGSGPYTKTVSLAAKSTYKFKPTYHGEWLGKANVSLTRASNSASSLSAAVEDELEITTDAAGDYTFTFTAPNSVSVTYPTAYVVTYSAVLLSGSGDYKSADPSAEAEGDIDVTSTDYVLAGKDVTFTAEAVNTGYTFHGWYSTNTPTIGTTTPLSSDEDDDKNKFTYTADDISGAVTVYAIYTEDMHTVSVVANDGYGDDKGGSVSISSVTAGISTVSASITATPTNAAWRFKHWVIAPGISAADGYDTHSNPLKINATSDGITLIAYFEPRYALMGSLAESENPAGGMPSPTWNDESAADFEVSKFDAVDKAGGVDLRCTRTLEPNKTYKFQVYDREIETLDAENYHTRLGLSSVTVLPAGESRELTVVNGSGDVRIQTVGRGDYTFKITKLSSDATYNRPTITVERQASWPVSIGQGYEDIDGTITSDDDTGGTMAAEATENGITVDITNGQYIASGGTLSYSATPATGYTLENWYGTSDYSTSPFDWTSFVVSKEPANVYAKFVETSTAVTISHNAHGHVTIDDETVTSTTVGVTTTRELVAVPDAGYYFAGWTVPVGADFELRDKSETEDAEVTLHGLGAGTAGTLTANFQPLDTIYFKNTLSWAKVFVYFNPSWDYAENPAYSKGVYPIGTEYTEMTNIGDNIYRALIPRSFTRNNYTKVAFSDVDMHTYDNFHENNAVYRDDWDYNTKTLDMYIPCVNTNDGATHRGTNKLVFNGTTYYNHGYWVKKDVKINDGLGYYIKNSSSLDRQFVAIANDEYVGKVTVRVDNLSDQTYFICSAGGREYSNTGITFTDGGGDNQTLYVYNSRGYFTVKPSAEGDYTFYLYQDGDHMSINVSYPVSPGDYRIRHSYTDGGTKYSYSDIIKKGTTSDKVSMFIKNTSGTLKIAKCRDLDENKKPVWTTGIDVTGYNAVNFPSAGVYVFDVAIVDDNMADPTKELTSATISNAAPYTGDYYIKTDCAPGGWVNYTQNVLDKNTINASDFDYYFCKNVANQTNVKFVIANDYNIQVTDTIIQDLTYLTTSGDGTSKEYMPESSCIRFSYNSATNEAKRAYLRYSNNNNFLNIIPSAASTVYDAASDGNDLRGDGSASATNKFGNDDGNFVYRKTVYAVSGATIDVKAEYNSNTQEFVSDKTLITSTDDAELYPVRVVYDFKTNHLTMAWEASAGLTDKLSKTEFLYIRNGQNAAGQVSLGTGGEVNNSKVCGVFQFDYDDYVGKVGAWPEQAGQDAGYTYSKCMFYFSFPFDVNVSDIFGLGTYGKEWKLQYYDGAERAKKGFFRGDGTTTFWKDVPADSVLTKNVGYSLLLDNDYFNTTATGMVFEGKSAGGSVFLYFPSSSAITLGQGATSIDVPSHECTLTQYWTEGDKTLYHSNTDSHWNMMGVPLFQSQTGDYSAKFKSVYDAENPFGYLYEWTPSTNSLNIANTSNFTFQSMNAYMVQYTGTVNFTGSNVASIVAAPQRKEEQNYTIDLEVLNSDDEHINRTYVELREGASDDFELNEDVYMTLNGKNVNVYSYAGDYDVAANVLSVANHIVPVGVVVKASGTYKFLMPSNFSGTVTLVDKFAQTRTILNIDDYEVTLNSGTINDRFELEINILNAPTAIDGVEGGSLKDGKAHKYIENGVMYILENGRIYNARGNRVK